MRHHVAQVLVVGVVEHPAALLPQVVVQLALGLLHALKRAEALQVRLAHAGDQAAGGLGDLHQSGDLAGRAGAHLHDGHLGLLVDAEEGERHADVVVEVGLGGHQVVFPAEDGGNEFLGGRLAVGTRDADHRNVELAAVVGRQLLQHGERVLDHDAFASLVRGAFQQEAVHDGIFGAGLQGCLREIVTVELLAFQGEEHHALFNLAAVRRNARTFLVQCV